MTRVEQLKKKIADHERFCGIVRKFEKRGVSAKYISKEIGSRGGDGFPEILPQPRISQIMHGNGYPSAEQLAALIGLAERDGII